MSICTLPLKAFVDPDYPNWLYQGIPPRLRRALEREYGHDLSRIPWDAPVTKLFGPGFGKGAFATYLTDAFIATHNPRRAFHGMLHHIRVSENGNASLVLMQQLFGTFPQELVQAHLFGLGTHDLGHPGAAFYTLARKSERPRTKDFDPMLVTVEARTARKVDAIVVRRNFSLLARLVANYTIISSAFGAGHPEYGPKLRLANVQPRALLGCNMRASDVTPIASAAVAFSDETALTYLETPAFPPPYTWREYLGGRRSFLGYVGSTHQALDRAVQQWLPTRRRNGYSLTHELGWQANLNHALNVLDRVDTGGGDDAVQTAGLRALVIVRGQVMT